MLSWRFKHIVHSREPPVELKKLILLIYEARSLTNQTGTTLAAVFGSNRERDTDAGTDICDFQEIMAAKPQKRQ